MFDRGRIKARSVQFKYRARKGYRIKEKHKIAVLSYNPESQARDET